MITLRERSGTNISVYADDGEMIVMYDPKLFIVNAECGGPNDENQQHIHIEKVSSA